MQNILVMTLCIYHTSLILHFMYISRYLPYSLLYIATGDSITYDSNLSFKILFLVTTPTLTSILLLVVSSFIISALTFIWCKRKAQVDFLKKDVMELPDDNEGFDSLRSDTTMITST